jgi:hypothetical protein
MHRLLPLLVTAPMLTACVGGAPDPALVNAPTRATTTAGTTLVAPSIEGDGPNAFTVRTADNSVSLAYGKGFTPTLTLRPAPKGDLCAGREPDWERCQRIDEDAVRLSFEEMDAVVVRRDGTEMFWSNVSFELPDEDYPTQEALVAAIRARAQGYVDAARTASPLSVEEFLDDVPKGKVAAS